MALLNFFRRTTCQEAWTQTRQQASSDKTTGVEQTSTEVGFPSRHFEVRVLKLSRTHRERKEQYIKALETEITRLRETFIMESETVQRQVRQQELMLQDQQRENMALKEMLAARGIQYEGELQTRKASIVLSSPNQRGISPNFSMPSTSPYAGVMPGPPSTGGYNSIHEQQAYSNGGGSRPGHSPGIKQHSNSPEVLEQVINQEDSPVADMPGIFEKDPQLGVDFILE